MGQAERNNHARRAALTDWADTTIRAAELAAVEHGVELECIGISVATKGGLGGTVITPAADANYDTADEVVFIMEAARQFASRVGIDMAMVPLESIQSALADLADLDDAPRGVPGKARRRRTHRRQR